MVIEGLPVDIMVIEGFESIATRESIWYDHWMVKYYGMVVEWFDSVLRIKNLVAWSIGHRRIWRYG